MMTLRFDSAANPQLRHLAKTLRRGEKRDEKRAGNAAWRRVISVGSIVTTGIFSTACGQAAMMMDDSVTSWVSELTALAATAIHLGLIVLSAVMNAG
jgi:hypothetical protein